MCKYNSTQQAAPSYADEHDLSLIPLRDKVPLVKNGLTNATRDLEVISAWWEKWPSANVGVACRRSGWLVIDVDRRNGGDDRLYDLEREWGRLPETPRSLTGDGFHVIFKNPNIKTVRALAPGIDIRDAAYVVAPPSQHPSGRYYAWEVGLDEASLAELPEAWLRELTRKRKDNYRQEGPILKGRRNLTMFHLSATMRSAGMGEDAILAALTVTNETRCEPPLKSSEVANVARSAGKLSVAPPWKLDPTGFVNGLAVDLTGIERSVLFVLCQRAGYDNRVWGLDWVVDESGFSVNTVQRAIKSLRSKGALIDTGERCRRAIVYAIAK